jgi:hypothetical protein
MGFSYAADCISVPTDNCQVKTNLTLVSGTYNLPNGIDIYAHGITLNCNGATLVGSSSSYGIYNSGWDNVIIKNFHII